MAPGTGLEAAAVHLPGRVEDHVQEAVHRQAEAPVDAPDRLLTLQRALGAQQEALAQVAADVGHRGQLGAGRRRRVQLRRGPVGPGPRLIRCWCCRRQTREAVAPRHGGGRGQGPTCAPRHLWLRPGPPASRRAGARPPGRALRAHRSGSSGRRRPAESPPASPAASAGRPAAPSWDRQGHSGQRRQPGAGPRPPGLPALRALSWWHMCSRSATALPESPGPRTSAWSALRSTGDQPAPRLWLQLPAQPFGRVQVSGHSDKAVGQARWPRSRQASWL